MGVTFRYGNYRKKVTFGKRTVKEGEAAAIWDLWGRHRLVIGPSRERLFFSTLCFLNRHVALPHQYLRVYHRSGSVEHVRGPVALFEDPVLYDKIEVRD